MFTINCIEKTKIKKKWPGMDHLKNRLKKFVNLNYIENIFIVVNCQILSK